MSSSSKAVLSAAVAGPSSGLSLRMRDAVDLLERVVDDERDDCLGSSSGAVGSSLFSISMASSTCGCDLWRGH